MHSKYIAHRRTSQTDPTSKNMHSFLTSVHYLCTKERMSANGSAQLPYFTVSKRTVRMKNIKWWMNFDLYIELFCDETKKIKEIKNDFCENLWTIEIVTKSTNCAKFKELKREAKESLDFGALFFFTSILRRMVLISENGQ